MRYLGAGTVEHEKHLYEISDGDYDERFRLVLLDFAQDLLGVQFLQADEVCVQWANVEGDRVCIFEDGDGIPFRVAIPAGWAVALVEVLLQEVVYFAPVKKGGKGG